MSKAKTENIKRRPGRPRSEAARIAILSAAQNILDDASPARLTIEAVAQRAGVGKPTIYRYWANAQELAMSALMDITSSAVANREKEDLASLQDLINEIVERLNTKRGRQMALILAGAEPDSELFKAFSNRVILEGRQRGLAILEAAQQAGDLGKETEPSLCIDMLLGAVFLRLLLRHETLDPATIQRAVPILLDGARGKRP